MKTLMLAVSVAILAAVPSLVKAQDVPSSSVHNFSASYVYDPFHDKKFSFTPAISYRLNTFHDLFGKSGFDADVLGLATVGDSIGIGTGLVHTFHLTLPISREFRPKVDLTIGPWTNYQPGESLKQIRAGLFVGVGGSF